MKLITYVHKGKVKNVSIDDLKKMKSDLTQMWESLCKNCGKCCFNKGTAENGKPYIDYDKPCEHLRFAANKSMCEVYSDRFTKCNKCLTIPDALVKMGLPGDCPYTKSITIYHSPTDDGNKYKAAKLKLTSRYDDDSAQAGTPTGATRNAAADLPVKEDIEMDDWKRRRKERKERENGGKQGILDPREKCEYNIKPSGHALGG